MSTYRHALDLAGNTPTSRNRYVDFLRAASKIGDVTQRLVASAAGLAG